MRVCISKAICLSIVLVPLVVGTQAPAGIHATVNVQIPGIDDTQFGVSYATAQDSYSSMGAVWSASATAQGMPGVSGVLVTGSSSISNSYGNPVYTTARWDDTLTLSGPAGSVLPDFVDLYFHTSCVMNLSGAGAQGEMAVGGGSFGSSFYYFGEVIDQLSGPGVWDSVQYGGGHLDGVWHQRLDLSGAPDALGNKSQDWRVLYFTRLDGSSDSTSTINGNDPPTFSFDAVRLPDGRTPEEAGLSLTFGSGIASPNLNAVPEPSSIITLATGVVGWVGYGWRRRKRTIA